MPAAEIVSTTGGCRCSRRTCSSTPPLSKEHPLQNETLLQLANNCFVLVLVLVLVLACFILLMILSDFGLFSQNAWQSEVAAEHARRR
jgi:hypothetical protein